MGVFQIDAEDFQWIDGKKDNPTDLCLHGQAVAVIGTETFKYKATISATALYLLKTLTEDHIIYEDNQMLPCCGHFIIPNEDLTNVDICGCPNGIDWSVIHIGNNVKLITDSGKETEVSLEEYRREVLKFADKVEEFYKKCTPKDFSGDEYEEMAYRAFWNEWNRRKHNE